MTLLCLSWIASSAQDSSKVCYTKAELQRIAYRVKHSMYCDSVIPEYQQVVMNLEEELGIANRQRVIQDERYNNLNYIFSTCSAERQSLTNENNKLRKKIKRTRIFGWSAFGLGFIGWVLVLI